MDKRCTIMSSYKNVYDYAVASCVFFPFVIINFDHRLTIFQQIPGAQNYDSRWDQGCLSSNHHNTPPPLPEKIHHLPLSLTLVYSFPSPTHPQTKRLKWFVFLMFYLTNRRSLRCVKSIYQTWLKVLARPNSSSISEMDLNICSNTKVNLMLSLRTLRIL